MRPEDDRAMQGGAVKRGWLLAVLLLAVLWAAVARAAPTDGSIQDADEDCVKEVGTCPIDLSDLADAPDASAPAPAATPPATATQRLVFFWGVGCPHCEAAKPFVDALARDASLDVERVEVRQDAAGRARFIQTMRELGGGAAGVPTFVVGRAYVVGYGGASTEAEVRAAIARGGAPTTESRVRSVTLPLLGDVDPTAISLPTFTLLIGLVDGVNPCAMWVLLVLLSILVHVKSRQRLLLFGGTFVLASGVVYFVFMTAWIGVFSLVGLSRPVTLVLGLVVLSMGLINLKELFWFKRGVSLMIPDKAKPTLFRRMRAIAASASLPAAFLGISVLAFLVNLIELGCTLGLPAVFTRILTLRSDLSGVARFGYLVLYNVAYVIPLAVIVAAYALTLHRLTLSERGAKLLKAVSGVLLVSFGLLFLLAPGVLT